MPQGLVALIKVWIDIKQKIVHKQIGIKALERSNIEQRSL